MVGSEVDGYLHEVAFYSADAELFSLAVPFLADGLDRHETVVIACSESVTALLTDALGRDERLVVAPRIGTVGRPVEAIARAQQMLLRETAAGVSRVRLVGEPRLGATSEEWTWWSPFEAVVNQALAPYPLWGRCIYDTRRQPVQVLRMSERTHPYVVTPDARIVNPSYVEPAEFVRALPAFGPDPLAQTTPAAHVTAVEDLAAIRRLTTAVALSETAVPERAVAEFVFALTEVATNGLLHGVGPVGLRVWAAPDRVVADVTDHGSGFDDPLAGYLPFATERIDPGHGLWMARRFCDHLDAECRPGGGFTVRLVTTQATPAPPAMC